VRILYNTSLSSMCYRHSYRLWVTDVCPYCTPIFSPVSDKFKISDQKLICYVGIHTDDYQKFHLYTELAMTEKCWLKCYMKLLKVISTIITTVCFITVFINIYSNIHIVVFWVVTPYSVTVGYQHFRGPCCLHLQDDMVQ